MNISNDCLKYLNQLSLNNNREWFEENKETFKLHQSEVKAVLEGVKEGLSETDDIENLRCSEYIEMFAFLMIKHPIKIIFQGLCLEWGNL